MKLALIPAAVVLIAGPIAAQTTTSGGDVSTANTTMNKPTVTSINGDPSAAGPFTCEFAVPAAYTITAFRHPSDQSISVGSGTLTITTNPGTPTTSTKTMTKGQSVTIKANVPVTITAKTAATYTVSSMGPYAPASTATRAMPQ